MGHRALILSVLRLRLLQVHVASPREAEVWSIGHRCRGYRLWGAWEVWGDYKKASHPCQCPMPNAQN
ncbi:hypothetical protein [Nostoc sp. FACHB-857]|uniref:Secreted protein n=1 Tax=Nostoc paludosum FACHB-159 TaxID=2692908 RepID=A0ABR8K1R2_9NOSO|nr:hypothetical protein [Nostoc sp. FACHB-857]MBD2678249.1 hypothetical protein [Nostoc sp. FACHB-857]MBD2733367.1 hypothetical protein [Nostoc paludosum FACHB-159]